MAVQPQTPYIEHIANGTTTGFNLGFDCDDQDHLIVLVDDVEPVVGSWSLTGGAVVFGAAPTSGRKITVQRNTPFERERDYQSYDNSFRPTVVNKDFDWIWLKLQELGVADWILGSRITDLKNYVDIQDDVLQENIDNLKGYVDLKDDELRAYLMEEIRKQGVALDQLDDYYNYLMQRLAQIAVDKGWDASFVTTASGQNQQQINDFGGAKWYAKSDGYELGATVKLANGDTVKSTIPNNANDPNVNMSGWSNVSQKINECVSVKDFGAKGDGDQTTKPVPLYNSGRDSGWKITEQTNDGDAFNKAIRYLRSVGGGSLYVPKGVYYVYAYLEKIDFPLYLYGDGGESIIKNCDLSPTNKNGYGILVLQPKPDVLANETYDITIKDLVLDGNAEVRQKPTSEFQLYPIVCYGWGRILIDNITSKNSPIDCINTGMDKGYEDKDTYIFVRGSRFINSYRNSVTVGKGKNIIYSQCTVERGGFVHGGTNPKACLDMEPNIATSSSTVIWNSCVFRSAINYLVAGVWSKGTFNNCIFDAGEIHEQNLSGTRDSFPWMAQFSAGQWDVSNCVFIGRSDTLKSALHHYNTGNETQTYIADSYLRIKGGSFDMCGIRSSSRSISLIDCHAQKSLAGWLFTGGTKNEECDVYIKDCHLKNMFTSERSSGGLAASCSIPASLKGKVYVDGLTCIVDKHLLEETPIELLRQVTWARGFGSAAESAIYSNDHIIKNVHCAGYYRVLPDHLGVSRNSNNYRDWATPALPPVDSDLRDIKAVLSLKDATVIKEDTLGADGVVVSSTYKLKDPTILSSFSYDTSTKFASTGSYASKGKYYKNCTMWGDYD